MSPILAGTRPRGAWPSVFQVGRNQRGDAEYRGVLHRPAPPPPSSSLPGGHATGADSGHRSRAETAGALAEVLGPSLRPPIARSPAPPRLRARNRWLPAGAAARAAPRSAAGVRCAPALT